MKNNLLDALCAGGASISIATILSQAQAVLGIISAVVAITVGIISIWLKLKEAMKDGKITPEEKNDIISEAEKLSEDIKKIKGDKNNDI